MKRNMYLSCGLAILFAQHAFALPRYKETDHFILNCLETDQAATDELALQAENFYDQLTHDLNHNYSQKIEINIYPDVKSFHEATNQPTAPDWIIGKSEGNIIYSVSPLNPGPDHSADSIACSIKTSMTVSFIREKYNNHQSIPRWLHQGVGLYKAHYYPQASKIMAKQLDQLPTIEDLEKVAKNDSIGFDKLHGFGVSYSLIEFIDQKWGWATILRLLEDYSKFDEIIGISKSAFREQWIEYIKQA